MTVSLAHVRRAVWLRCLRDPIYFLRLVTPAASQPSADRKWFMTAWQDAQNGCSPDVRPQR